MSRRKSQKHYVVIVRVMVGKTIEIAETHVYAKNVGSAANKAINLAAKLYPKAKGFGVIAKSEVDEDGVLLDTSVLEFKPTALLGHGGIEMDYKKPDGTSTKPKQTEKSKENTTSKKKKSTTRRYGGGTHTTYQKPLIDPFTDEILEAISERGTLLDYSEAKPKAKEAGK